MLGEASPRGIRNCHFWGCFVSFGQGHFKAPFPLLGLLLSSRWPRWPGQGALSSGPFALILGRRVRCGGADEGLAGRSTMLIPTGEVLYMHSEAKCLCQRVSRGCHCWEPGGQVAAPVFLAAQLMSPIRAGPSAGPVMPQAGGGEPHVSPCAECGRRVQVGSRPPSQHPPEEAWLLLPAGAEDRVGGAALVPSPPALPRTWAEPT